MIRYALACADGHRFDGWFRSSADYDAQAARGLVTCAVCGGGEVAKALMAPAVRTAKETEVPASGTAGAATMPSPPPQPPASPLALASAGGPLAEALAALRELRARIVANAEDVGPRFGEEARRIHYGEVPARGIYGAASPEEARALVEEGIEILPLPALPDEHN